MTKECKISTWSPDLAKKQRERRKAVDNVYTRRYEKTINGFLMRTYRNMKSRISGIQKKKAHLYEGLDLLSKEDFYGWAKSDTVFNELFAVWTTLGYEQRYTPSIDRIDSKLGYVKGNIRWLTHSENSRLGNVSRFQKR